MITRTKLENIFQTNNTQRDIVYKKLQPTNRNIIRKRNNLFGFNILTDYQADTKTRTAAEAESRARKGCCNRRLSGLVGDVAKIYFQTQSNSKPEYLRSKQQPTADNFAEALQADRVPLSNETSDPFRSLVKCDIVADYRTVVDDLLKFVEFIDWLHDNYPELLPLHSKSL